MSATDLELLRTIGSMYAHAHTPTPEVGMVRAVRDAMHGHSAGLFWVRPNVAQPQWVTVGHSDRSISDYLGRYARLDPLGHLLEAQPLGTPLCCDAWLEPAYIGVPTLINDFLRPHNIRHLAAVRIDLGRNGRAMLGVQRGDEAMAFDEPAAQRLATLLPHVAGVLNQIANRTSVREQVAVSALLQRLDGAVVLVDPAGHILSATPLVTQFMSRQPLIRVVHQHLSAVDADVQKMLQTALDDINAGVPERHLAVRRGHGITTITFRGIPAADVGGLPGIKHAALVTLRHRGALPPHPSPSLLCTLFDFSQAEARMAAGIVGGALPQELAEQFGVSISTARSHVAAILRKTECAGQTELVRLLAGLPSNHAAPLGIEPKKKQKNIGHSFI